MSKPSFYVIAIGLSIGGIDPLIEIISCFPEKSNATYLIIQHLDRTFPSKLSERLQAVTKIKVSTARDGQVLQSNRIYVLAEGQMMTVKDGCIILRERRHDENVNKAVDILFESMAEELGVRAVSIILSGLDGDGTLGSTQINLHGGITIAQSPESAKYPSMPESAVASGQTQFVLSPNKIASMVAELVKI
jgi:chemotaxis response regulator CheB